MTGHSHISAAGYFITGFLYLFTFILVPFLVSLAYHKKKYLSYSEQLLTHGKVIDQLKFSMIFDHKLPAYLFRKIAPVNRLSQGIESDEAMIRLHRKINTLTLITKQMSVALVVCTITVALLLAIYR
jgi:hypothetical protein